MRTPYIILLGALVLVGCDQEVINDEPLPGVGPQLVVTTTDFATGSVSIVEPGVRKVRRDVALGSTDAIPYFAAGDIAILHRFSLDYIDVLDPLDYSLKRQHALTTASGASANAHSLYTAPDARSYLTLYGAPEVQVHDLQAASGQSLIGRIDLSQFADADGTCEADLIFAIGDRVFVTVQRLDQGKGWSVAAPELLLELDLTRQVVVDLDEQVDGVQGLEVPIRWARQWRRDPLSDDAVYLLGDQIARFDSASNTIEVVADKAAMGQIGVESFLQPQSFVVEPDGNAVVASYDADFEGVRLYRVKLDEGSSPPVIDELVGGFDAVERTLEIGDGELWFGSTRAGEPGMWGLDEGGTPMMSSPLSLGLPPYSMAWIAPP